MQWELSSTHFVQGGKGVYDSFNSSMLQRGYPTQGHMEVMQRFHQGEIKIDYFNDFPLPPLSLGNLIPLIYHFCI